MSSEIKATDFIALSTTEEIDNESYSQQSDQLKRDMITQSIEICKTLGANNFNPTFWVHQLQQYINKYDRLMYSEISRYIFELCKEDDTKIGTIESNLEIALGYTFKRFAESSRPPIEPSIPINEPSSPDYSEINEFNPDNAKQQNNDQSRPANIGSSSPVIDPRKMYYIVIKIQDHVNLAHRQYLLSSEGDQTIKKLVEERLKESSVEVTRKLTTDLIALVAIFTALSFVIFGGISSLEGIFSTFVSLKHAVLPTLIITAAWSFCICNLLFGFMYFVLRMTGHEVRSTGNLVQRYPVIFLTNFLLLSLGLICIAILFIETNGLGIHSFRWIVRHGTGSFCLIIGLLIVIIVAIGGALLHFYKKRPKNDKIN